MTVLDKLLRRKKLDKQTQQILDFIKAKYDVDQDDLENYVASLHALQVLEDHELFLMIRTNKPTYIV